MKKTQLFWLLVFLLSAGTVVSCSETDDEEAYEYANWQARNDAYFATLEDSLSRGGSEWKKIKAYTKDEKTPGVNTDYIYIKVLKSGGDGPSPLYSDSVRVAYRGRLIPSATYSNGYVFDQTYVGNYNFNTTSVLDGAVGGFTNGFATALLHMNRNDRWRVYIPYQLGYGVSGTTGIPGCSVLIFDLVLIDFAEETGKLYPWTSREI
jgi:FKBP-type peptidyl-prolyl cis-trans isomerase FklB